MDGQVESLDDEIYVRLKSKSMKRVFLLLFSFLLSIDAIAQTPAPIKFIDFILTPDHGDWNYQVNENASVKVSVLKFGVPVKDVSLNYEIGPELLPADKKGSLMLVNGEGKIDMGTSKQPGFRQLKVSAAINGKIYNEEIKVGYSPGKIMPTVAMPADFLQFWNNVKEEAAKIPMDAIVTHLPGESTTTVDVFFVN